MMYDKLKEYIETDDGNWFWRQDSGVHMNMVDSAIEEIERRTLRAVGAKRTFIHFPIGLLRQIVAVMETLLPSPPVTRSLLELLQVSNVTKNNGLKNFVDSPRPFTTENAAGYMQKFKVSETLAQFMGK